MQTTATLFAVLLAAGGPEPAPGAAPPDPRLGERLDGREVAPEQDEAGRTLPRLLLAPVRAAAWLVLTPLDRATGFAERHKLPDRVYEALTSDDRLLGVRPLVKWQSSQALAVGLRVFDRRTLGPGSLLEASGRAGLRSLEGGVNLEPPGPLGLRLELDYDRRSDAIYGGLEGDDRAALRANGREVVRYAYEKTAGVLTLRQPLGRVLALQVSGALDRRRYGDGHATDDEPAIRSIYCTPPVAPDCRIDPEVVPGFEEGLFVARGEAAVELDTRPHARFGSGLLARLAGGYARGVSFDPSRHRTVRVGLGGVAAFGDRTLALHLRAGIVDPLGDAPVPFDELLSPSGSGGMRGLPRGRLRGRSEAVVTAEYRWLLAPWLDAVLFVDRGNAFAKRFTNASLAHTFTSFGLALQAVDLDKPAYWRSPPLYGVQLAITPDDGFRVAFALHAW
jgi:hypothetical protein